MSNPVYVKAARSGSTNSAAPLTFPDILCDPLIRMVMAADRVDPRTLRAELREVATGLGFTPAECGASPCAC